MACFPLTPPRKSNSGDISPASVGLGSSEVFFINPPLRRGGPAAADQTDCRPFFRIDHDQQNPSRRTADIDIPALTLPMESIGNREGQRVCEEGSRLLERNLM